MRSFLKLGLLLLVFSCFQLEINGQVYKIENKDIADIRLSIYLPSGYDTIKGCKVLYFNDGQTVFGKYGLDVDGTAEELIKNKLIDPIIVVGIHSDRNRTSNYVPYFDEGAKEDFGDYKPNTKAFTQKIIKEIIQFIEKNYKASSVRGIAGYSFGGLHATWAALNHPNVFSFSGSLSPSYWVNDFEIFKEASKATTSQKYYFDVGTGEWNYYVPMILHSKLPLLKNIFYYEDEGGDHDLDSWKGQRIKNILLLFAGNTDTSQYRWDVKLEIIESKYTGKFYPRINPLVTYSNGLTCSISYAATFTLLNAEDGVVNKDGSFRFISPKDLKVKIIYKSKEKLVTINYKEVEEIMKH